MKKKLTLALDLCVFMVFLAGCACKHGWKKADCTTPKTCIFCGETEGEPLEHDWLEASCERAKTCSGCGKTEGAPLGHQWIEATCSVPKTCSDCGETEGEALGHTPGEWAKEDIDYSVAMYYYVKRCTVCDEVIDNHLEIFDSLKKYGHFLFTPHEFASILQSAYTELDCSMTTKFTVLDDNTMACGIIYKGDAIAAIMFNNDMEEMNGDDIESRDLSSMKVYYNTEDASVVVDAMLGIMLACDPKLGQVDAIKVAEQVVDASLSGDYYEYHGIKYGLFIAKGSSLFVVSVLEQ